MKTLEEIKQCKRLLVGHAGLDRSQPFSWNEDMAEVAIEDMES